MRGNVLALLEMLLVFGVVAALGARELLALREPPAPTPGDAPREPDFAPPSPSQDATSAPLTEAPRPLSRPRERKETPP